MEAHFGNKKHSFTKIGRLGKNFWKNGGSSNIYCIQKLNIIQWYFHTAKLQEFNIHSSIEDLSTRYKDVQSSWRWRYLQAVKYRLWLWESLFHALRKRWLVDPSSSSQLFIYWSYWLPIRTSVYAAGTLINLPPTQHLTSTQFLWEKNSFSLEFFGKEKSIPLSIIT